MSRALRAPSMLVLLLLPLVLMTVTAEAASSSSSPPLEGTNWVLTSRAALGVPLRSAAVSAQFGSDGTLSGQVACNRYNTSYTVKGSSLTINRQIAATQASCSPAENAVSRVYLARLPRVRSFTIKGTTLTLLGSGDSRLLTYRASGADDLIGKWITTSFYTGTAISSPVAGSVLNAEFTRTSIAGEGGCNLFNGMYTVDGSSIAIGPLASTLRACIGNALSTQEQQYLAALELAKTFRVTGTKLELLRDGGTIAATFDRAK